MKRLRALLSFVTRERETTWTFSAIVGLVYFAYLAWAHSHHELWRDEIHSWTIARLADGFGDIVTGDRVYEGHPPLWFWYLRVWSWLTDRAWGLHAATVVAVGTGAVLFLRFAPFARVLKVLLLCSYLIGYEYGVISRNYSLGFLLLVLFCCSFRPLRPRALWSSVVLGLLCITSAYGAVMACSLFLVLAATYVSASFTRTRPRLLEITASPRVLLAGAALLVALAFSFKTSSPPDPNPFAQDWNFAALNRHAIEPAIERVVYAFLPVRVASDTNCWRLPWEFWKQHETARLWVGVALLAVSCISLAPAWSSLLAFVVGVGLMMFLQTALFGGGIRHWGHAFLLYLAVCWIARKTQPRAFRRLSSLFLLVVGAFQLHTWLVLVGVDRTRVFSGGEETAAFIERAGLQDLPIVAGPDWFVITVTGYLRRPYVSSETEEFNQTVVFHARRRKFSARALVDRAVALQKEKHGSILVLSNQALPGPSASGLTMKLLFSSRMPIMVDGEQFFVYELK